MKTVIKATWGDDNLCKAEKLFDVPRENAWHEVLRAVLDFQLDVLDSADPEAHWRLEKLEKVEG